MGNTPRKPSLSHIDSHGEARMVDVSHKTVTVREATASAVVTMRPEVIEALWNGALPKGDALAVARVAGIQAAKRTSEWIPLCHPLAVEWVGIDFVRGEKDKLTIHCSVKTSGRTGVEMEALTGAGAAALAIYDMAKAADRSIVIGPIQLEKKSGGRSGDYNRAEAGKK